MFISKKKLREFIKTEFENALQFVSSDPYDAYTKKANQNMLDVYKTAPGPEVVAKKVFKAANDSSYKLRYPVGGQGPLLLFIRWLLPLSWFNALVRKPIVKALNKLGVSLSAWPLISILVFGWLHKHCHPK